MDKKTLFPKERRIKTEDTQGVLDNDGFFTTPNGSFWDCDGEYFNREGYDINGGSYANKLDYIPGPTWIEELGCYPEDKDKYMNQDFDNFEEDEEEGDPELLLKEGEPDICIDDYKKLGITKEQLAHCLEKYPIDNKNNKKKNKKSKKHKEEEDEEWEECDDEDDQ